MCLFVRMFVHVLEKVVKRVHNLFVGLGVCSRGMCVIYTPPTVLFLAPCPDITTDSIW